jgi:trk/ktr system potassium uptake protein
LESGGNKMRVVFLGASNLTVTTAKLAIESGHEVVIVELDPQRIDELSGELDCGFIQGDGSFPSILEEVGPENTDFLICFTDNDQDNIIASLVGQRMGFGQVITRIDNPDFGAICKQLKLEDVFNPDKLIADTLVDTIEGYKRARHTTELIGDLYFFKFQVTESTEKKLDSLDLPKDTQLVCVFREDKAYLVSNLEMLKEDDVVTLITREKQIQMLSEKFELPRQHKSKNKNK